MCFIERETQNFIVKLREICPWRETGLMAHGMKSEQTRFLVEFTRFFEKKFYML